jgi:hypothetical protein
VPLGSSGLFVLELLLETNLNLQVSRRSSSRASHCPLSPDFTTAHAYLPRRLPGGHWVHAGQPWTFGHMHNFETRTLHDYRSVAPVHSLVALERRR